MEHIDSLLSAVVHSAILFDGLLDDLLTGLSSFADRLHLEFHLDLISLTLIKNYQGSRYTSFRRNGFAKLISKPILSYPSTKATPRVVGMNSCTPEVPPPP